MERGPTGYKVPISSVGEPCFAFIPNPLPPEPAVTVDAARLQKASVALGKLSGVTSLLPDPHLFIYSYIRKEAVLSSQIEGTQSTLSELLLFENEAAAGVPLDDVQEVSNYVAAMKHGLRRLQEGFPLSLRLIREIHAELLAKGRGAEKQPGDFRTSQNWIGGSRPGNGLFVPPPPDQLLSCLGPLENFLHDEKTPSLVRAALAHVQFETIHPFLDGNGRIGRLLLALMLQQKCKMTKPWLYLSDYFEKYRDEYIQGLFRISTDADWETWIEFCLNATIAQATATISRCERLLSIRQQYQARLNATGGHIRLQSIVEQIFSSPFVRVIDVQSPLSITYPTAKVDLQKLTEAGILRLLPGASPKTYYAPEVFNVAYEDIADGDTNHDTDDGSTIDA